MAVERRSTAAHVDCAGAGPGAGQSPDQWADSSETQ